METFSALLTIFAGNSPVTGEFPSQRPVKRSFVVFFDLRLKGLSKQEPGDLRRRRAHYDVIVLQTPLTYTGTVPETTDNAKPTVTRYKCLLVAEVPLRTLLYRRYRNSF